MFKRLICNCMDRISINDFLFYSLVSILIFLIAAVIMLLPIFTLMEKQ